MVEKMPSKPKAKRKAPLNGHLAVTLQTRDAVNELASGLKLSQDATLALLLRAFTGGDEPYKVGKEYRERNP